MRIQVKCQNCKKEIYKRIDKIKKHKNNFCSNRCFQLYCKINNIAFFNEDIQKDLRNRAYYSNKKNRTGFFNSKLQSILGKRGAEVCRKKKVNMFFDKTIQSRAGKIGGKRAVQIMKKNKSGICFDISLREKYPMPLKDSSIEVKIQNYLKQLGIRFFTHQYIKEIKHSYQCDIFIPKQNNIITSTIIECDGDAFHFNPNKYKENDRIYKKGRTAKIRWALDKIRTEEILQNGYNIIRLWGSEIEVLSLEDFKNKLFNYNNCKEV